MQTDQFDFDLPSELIAQEPAPHRTDARMLVMHKRSGTLSDRYIRNFPDFIGAGDLIVFNNTQVIPARVFGQKATGGKIEVLVERILEERRFSAHLKASKAPQTGSVITLDNGHRVNVLGRDGPLFLLELEGNLSLLDVLDQIGHVPLPPYITRPDESSDRQRYQTVYGSEPGAIAAPTAGLHFDEALIAQCEDRGAQAVFLTLHVGAGTFQPVRVDDVSEHRMHREEFIISPDVADSVNRTRESGHRVVAIGTTTVRALEAAAQNGLVSPGRYETDIFIYPGYQFQIVDALLTNFHLPKSTLLMLVSAFSERQFVLSAYAHAVRNRYRFFSYGDAMWITDRDVDS